MVEKKFACGMIRLIASVLIYSSAAFSYASGPETASKEVRGAIYVPYEAYNAPQMWKTLDLAVTRRDFGYAKELHLNALRIWASYEYWQTEPAKFEASFDQLLTAANGARLGVLFALFENDGVEPTPENMWTTDPHKAYDVKSPGSQIAHDKTQWEKPRGFVQWFMKKYANDPRLIGIEVMNEPTNDSVDFAKSMFTTAVSMRGTVPLTIGAARLARAVEFLPLGENLIEFHDNFPPDLDTINREITEAMAEGRKSDVPVWLTEWQRVRPGGSGFGTHTINPAEAGIDYSSLAGDVRKFPVGNFFWSLMVKPAYLRGQRVKGTVNGLFWPDGSVWSLKDARAIANDDSLQLKEKPLPPNFLDVSTRPQGGQSEEAGKKRRH